MGKQLEVPGTEQPKNQDIENAIDAWLEAKDEQKYATERTKLRHAALLLQMQNAGIDAYPFVDPKNGKKKQVVIARDPKAKTLKAPRWNRRDGDAEVGEEVEVREADDWTEQNSVTPPVDNVVEMRRVKREDVESEIDPFGAVRGAMDGQDSDAPAETQTHAPAKRRKRSK